MSSSIVEWFKNNWLVIPLIFLFLYPYIPQKLADPFGHQMGARMNPPWPEKPWSLFKFLLRNFFEGFSEFALNLGLKGSVSVVLFAVVGTDLYFNKTVSINTVIVIVVAVISLYLEEMIKNADEIEFFRIFKYKSKPKSENVPSVNP